MSEFRNLVALPAPDLDPARDEFVAALLATPEFDQARRYFSEYPELSLLYVGGIARAFLYLLCRLTRPRWALEIGTYRLGTTEVLARALWANGEGEVATVDPFGEGEIRNRLQTWEPTLRALCHPFVADSMLFFNRAKNSGWRYDVVFIDGDHDFEPAAFDVSCAAAVLNPGGFIVVDNADQPGPREAARRFLRDRPGWKALSADGSDLATEPPLVSYRDGAMSVPGTSLWVLRAPASLAVGEGLAFFPQETVAPAVFGGFEIEPARGVPVPRGTLRYKLYLRAIPLGYWDGVVPQEYDAVGAVATDPGWAEQGPVVVALPDPIGEIGDLAEPEKYRCTVEIFLSFAPAAGERTRLLLLQGRPRPLFGPLRVQPGQPASGRPDALDRLLAEAIEAAGRRPFLAVVLDCDGWLHALLCPTPNEIGRIIDELQERGAVARSSLLAGIAAALRQDRDGAATALCNWLAGRPEGLSATVEAGDGYPLIRLGEEAAEEPHARPRALRRLAAALTLTHSCDEALRSVRGAIELALARHAERSAG
jgi:predicted O-methyltransferase YrrM